MKPLIAKRLVPAFSWEGFATADPTDAMIRAATRQACAQVTHEEGTLPPFYFATTAGGTTIYQEHIIDEDMAEAHAEEARELFGDVQISPVTPTLFFGSQSDQLELSFSSEIENFRGSETR